MSSTEGCDDASSWVGVSHHALLDALYGATAYVEMASADAPILTCEDPSVRCYLVSG